MLSLDEMCNNNSVLYLCTIKSCTVEALSVHVCLSLHVPCMCLLVSNAVIHMHIQVVVFVSVFVYVCM